MIGLEVKVKVLRLKVAQVTILNYLINMVDGMNLRVGKVKKIENKNTSNKHRWWLLFNSSELFENLFTKGFFKTAFRAIQ